MDVLRVFSIAAVVLGHAYGPRIEGTQFLEIWRMPLFFFLTGYFWTAGRSFTSEVRNRWTTLGIPYLLWAVLMSIAAWFWTLDTPEELTELLQVGWYGGSDQPPPWWAFWFISVLFFVAVLRRFLERFPAWVAWVVALAGLGLAELPDSLLGRTPLGIGLALPCLFFVLCGELFRTRIQPRIPRFRALIGALVVAAGLGAVWLGLEPMNIKFSGFGLFLLSPLVGALMAAGMVLLFSTVVDRVTRPVAALVTPLVRTGTVVVLFHGWLLETLVHQGILEDDHKFWITLLTSWAVGLVIVFSPLAPWLAGVPAPRWMDRWRGRQPSAPA